MKSFAEAQKLNAGRLHQYTYVEEADHIHYGKDGKVASKNSETSEYIFVEGMQYKKLIAREGKPLSSSEQAKEEKRLKETAAERRRSRLSSLTHKNVSLANDDELLTVFDSRIVGEEMLDGHKVWVIECTPRALPPTSDKHQNEVRSFTHKLWIDREDRVAVQRLDTVARDNVAFAPGSTILIRQQKLPDGVWAPATLVIDGRLSFAKFVKPAVRTEYRYTDFRKFDVQSTITTDPPLK